MQILDRVWSYDFGGDGRIVESYVYYLRRKIDKHGPPLIHTVRGVGYGLSVAEDSGADYRHVSGPGRSHRVSPFPGRRRSRR